jgi:hypothetical protein
MVLADGVVRIRFFSRTAKLNPVQFGNRSSVSSTDGTAWQGYTLTTYQFSAQVVDDLA